MVDFQSESAKDLEDEFHKAVDDYLEFCAEIGKEPQKQVTAKVDKREAFKHFLSLFPEKASFSMAETSTFVSITA